MRKGRERRDERKGGVKMKEGGKKKEKVSNIYNY